MPEIGQGYQRVSITMPRNKETDPTFKNILKIRILLSNEGGEPSAQEVETKAALLLKWLGTLINPRVLKRFGELLSEHLKG